MTNCMNPIELAKLVEELRHKAIFEDGGTELSPMAEQHYLLAVAALEQAGRHFKLAHLCNEEVERAKAKVAEFKLAFGNPFWPGKDQCGALEREGDHLVFRWCARALGHEGKHARDLLTAFHEWDEPAYVFEHGVGWRSTGKHHVVIQKLEEP